MRAPIAIGVLLALVSAHASAATLTFRQGFGYSGTRDTELRFVEPSLNSGAAESISVDDDDGPGSYNPTHGLLAFDAIFGAGPGQITPTDAVVKATLTLEIFSAGSGWRWHEMLKPWNEDSDTWNTWTNGIQADGVEAVAAAVFSDGLGDGNGNVESGTYVLDVTESLKKWSKGTLTNHGWAILPFAGGTNGIDFDSSESLFEDAGAGIPLGSTRPLLTVETAPVPLPGAVWLLGSAVVGLSALRRRQARA